MTKHLTLLIHRIFPIFLFIGLAWGQESIAEKILNEEIEHLENILPESLSDCFKIENRPERLSCIAKVYGSDEDDEQAMNLVRRLDDVMYKANFDKINSDNKWIVSENINPLDDSKTIVLLLQSKTGENHYGQEIDLVIRCNSSKVDVFIDWGVFLGSDLTLTTRIDKEKAISEKWSTSSDKKASFSYKPVSLARISFIRELSNTPPPIVSYPPSPCGTPPTVSFRTLLSASFEV